MPDTEKTIKEWMGVFNSIYANADINRTPEQIWIAIMAHASKIGESIRTFSIYELSNSASHTFCWLCSFINKCNTLNHDIFALHEDLSSIVTLKYPGACGHCGHLPCDCDSVKMDEEKDKSAKYTNLLALRNRLSYSNFKVKDFIDMFTTIYKQRIHIQTLESIGFHFLEETGEGAFAIRKLSQLQKIHIYGIEGVDSALYDELTTVESIVEKHVSSYKIIQRLKDEPQLINEREPDILKARVIDAKLELLIEIGDTFSWFCGIINKLSMIEQSIWGKSGEHTGKMFQNFETTLNNEYIIDGKALCPTCHSTPCSCAFFNEEKE